MKNLYLYIFLIFNISILYASNGTKFNGIINIRYEDTKYLDSSKNSTNKEFIRIINVLKLQKKLTKNLSFGLEFDAMSYYFENKKSNGYASIAQAYLDYKFNKNYSLKLGRFYLNRDFAPFLYSHRRQSFLSMQYDAIALTKRDKNSKITIAWLKNVIKQKRAKSVGKGGLFLVASKYKNFKSSIYYAPHLLNKGYLYSLWGSVEYPHFGAQALYSKEKNKSSTYALATYYKNRISKLGYKLTLGYISAGYSTISLYKTFRDSFKKSYRNIRGGFWGNINLMFGSFATGLEQKILKLQFKYKVKKGEFCATLGYDKSGGKKGYSEKGAIFGYRFRYKKTSQCINWTIYQKHTSSNVQKRVRLQWNVAYKF